MAVLADVSVAPSAFPLGELLTSEPVARIEFERAVQFGSCPTQFCWVTADTPHEVRSQIQSLDSIADAQVYGSVEHSLLVCVEWAPDFRTEFVRMLSERGIAVLEAVGADRMWSLRLRAPDDAALGQLYDDCTASSIQFEIEQLYARSGSGRCSPMTDKQSEAVTAAFENGFFDVPRRTTLGELSEQFDVSEQALSKLIRRGVHAVLSEHFS
ncbi:helix-turn-helix domain-containing protein [Natranaeroarchaeum aerophilus]|uniref:Helix-turn-helix domain-containing protein n=1 Tax=Natranaeroarchaeum aerophilus TaxID=2917711 RepID=A0AAE3FSV8_9EURY|nr:helix-turn-helix domain-containing protein [Natranaeroarchaeum aerophilus]MCL9814718.1 helix-turn-helix domain-containing protein [Natranaeroarchaeum aerophilus]